MKKKRKLGRKLLSFLLTLAMTVGLMPGMGLTVYAETQVNQVNYWYNGGMTLNTISADFYEDDSLKSFSATYTWGHGDVKQSLVLLDKLLACGSVDYATTYCKDDNNDSITTYEDSKKYVVEKNPGTKFVAESGNPDTVAVLGNGTHTKTLSLAKGAVPSDVSKTYYLFLWTSKSPGEVYPDYHLATVIVSGGKVYLGKENTPPSIPTYTVTFNTQSHGTAPAGQSVTAGGKATKPADPTAEGFTFGGWYKEESCTTAWDFDTDTVTGATTLYAKWIERAKVITPPVPKVNLAYTGDPQELATAGTPENGTMQYALGTDSTNVPTSGWSTSIPTGTDAGTYYVWYRVKGDLNHYDSEPRCVTVNIANALYTVTSVENWEHTIDYPNDIIITVKRNTADSITYSMYTGASVDGNGIPADGSSVAQGSLILTLKGSYLDTLSTGTHKVTISFKDGSADATISIVNAPPAPTAAPTHVPKTGDGANLVLWIGLILLGFLGIIAFAGMAGRKHRNR